MEEQNRRTKYLKICKKSLKDFPLEEDVSKRSRRKSPAARVEK